MQFHEKRRQQFLSETAFTITTEFFTNTANPGYSTTLHASELAAMLDGAFAGKDTLYEDLFAYGNTDLIALWRQSRR